MVLLASGEILFRFFKPQSIVLTVLVLSTVAACGLALGAVRIAKLQLGIGGVLFAGLFFGRWLGNDAFSLDALEFARDFGLILFVYTIGVQIGPGFIASLRRQGLPLNLAAAAIVLMGAILAILVSKLGHIPMGSAVGLFAGATTNTPSLAAAQQALHDAKGAADTGETVAAYAIAYLFGIIGIITVMVLVRAIFRIDLHAETSALSAAGTDGHTGDGSLFTRNLEVTNPNLDGLPLQRVPGLGGDVYISRLLHQDKLSLVGGDTVIHTGDVLLAVGPQARLDDAQMIIGRVANVSLSAMPSTITARRILVTRSEVLGKTVAELNLQRRYSVIITRVRRGEIELPPGPQVMLQFGDTLMAVGEEAALQAVAQKLGNSSKRLNQPQIITVFLGIALGVIVGSIPLFIPGMPAPVKLGLAGGPLLVAIVLSRLGHIGPLVWHLPLSANLALRDVGIVMFLSCVGLKSGSEFFNTLAHGPGVYWMTCGAIITAVPLLSVALFARMVMKMNYLTLCGLLAGSMTDPPALQFAGTVTQSDSPAIAYAAVYPLVMLLRVLAAQILVLAFA
ncbi:MAG: putative transporter [Burkholderiales bacterium]|nr:putative transporter [Phycisphaerae bacterium]